MTDLLTYSDRRSVSPWGSPTVWKFFVAPPFVILSLLGLLVGGNIVPGVFGGFLGFVFGAYWVIIKGQTTTVALRRDGDGFAVVENGTATAKIGPGPHRVEARDTPNNGQPQGLDSLTMRDLFVTDAGRVVLLSRGFLTSDQAFARRADIQAALDAACPAPLPSGVAAAGGFTL